MIEVRFHGRGGQGSVIASGILAEAAFKEGKDVQSFPFFGVERRGAPVAAFTRIDSAGIKVRHQIYSPNYVIVLDPTLIEKIDVVKGLKSGGSILINSDKKPEEFDFGEDFRIATVNASSIAKGLGLGGRASPIVNTTLLGAISKFTGIVKIRSVLNAIQERVPIKKKENMLAARLAYEKVNF